MLCVKMFFKLVVPPPWATFLHSVQIAQVPLSLVLFETEVFPHSGDTTGDSLAFILHMVTQFAHARN